MHIKFSAIIKNFAHAKVDVEDSRGLVDDFFAKVAKKFHILKYAVVHPLHLLIFQSLMEVLFPQKKSSGYALSGKDGT